MTQALIFDKDGTLFDFAGTWGPWTRRVIAQESGADAALATRLAAAVGFDLDAERFAPHSPAIAGTVAELADLIAPLLPPSQRGGLLQRLDSAAADVPLHPVCDLPALLGGLAQQGYRLGLVTNDSAAPTQAHLQAAGIADLFGFVAGYDSGHGAKPEPGPCLAAARALDVPPEACAMIGDSLTDLRAGAAAGMRPVAVLTGVASAAILAPEAEIVLPSIQDLPGWLAQG